MTEEHDMTAVAPNPHTTNDLTAPPPGPQKAKSRSLGYLAVVALVSAFWIDGPTGRAQSSPPLPGMLPKKQIPAQLQPLTSKTKPGYWAEYAVRRFSTGQALSWRIAMVGRAGRHKQWWEHVMRWGRMRSLVLKVLLLHPERKDAKVLKAIMQPGGQQAIQVPISKTAHMVDLYIPAMHQKARDLGEETIQVKAGRFRARHFVLTDRRGRKTHFWTSDKVPIYGLVKLLSPAMRMELTGHGTDAVSQIRGKVGRWPFPVKP